ncbi:winged helix-turn-helix domain-containing protein [Pleionea mediterranea]|uniref:DNA-binding winged helix-turn-helix (WHTH) protein n=1 Tax=Pleionea mediterranea TaxID=523701 RepID=A0A316FWQ5_9GAMM|nr:winged helix-turn-helix domain-containing protein [Pleionea mediterranea]PWK53244.1 DNA-binding winged helix-turn-helix (wHTH) protein [Pleionea mediterranea]
MTIFGIMALIKTIISLYMSHVYKFNKWSICTESNQLRSNQKLVNLEPQAMAVLAVLLKSDGLVVSREQLIEEAWRGAIVGDSSVNRIIAQLRKILGDDAKNSQLIETIHKKGYRLLQPVTKIAAKDLRTDLGIVLAYREKLTWLMGVVFLIAIAFTIFQYNMAWDGQSKKLSPVVKLTHEKGYEYDVDISSDGKYLVYLSKKPETAYADLYVKSISHEVSWKVDSDSSNLFSPAFSPDSQSIGFIKSSDDSCAIFQLSVDDIKDKKFIPTTLYECDPKLPPVSFKWGAENSTIFIAQEAAVEAPNQIVKVNLNVGTSTPITFPASSSWGDTYFDVNKQNGKVAFLRKSPYKQQLFVLDPKSKNLEEIPLNVWGTKSVSWLEKERSLLLASKNSISTLDLDKLITKSVFVGNNIDQAIADTNSGKVVVVEKLLQADLMTYSVQEGKNRKLEDTDSLDRAPIYLTGQKQIAFVSDRTGKQQIWIAKANGEIIRQLTDVMNDYSFFSLDWSAQNKQLIAWELDRNQIWVFDFEENTFRMIFESESLLMFPVFSTSENLITFGSNKSGDWEIWAIDRDGDNLQRLTYSGGFYGKFDDNHQQLFFTKYHDKGVWRKNILLNSTEPVITQEPRQDYPWWQLHGDAIYIERGLLEESGIYRYDLDGKFQSIIIRNAVFSGKRFSFSDDFQSVVSSEYGAMQGDLKLFEFKTD